MGSSRQSWAEHGRLSMGQQRALSPRAQKKLPPHGFGSIWHLIIPVLVSSVVVDLLAMAGSLYMLPVYARVLASRCEETL